MEKYMFLVTHNGKFHADDVFSYTILKNIFPDSKLIRTRDEHILQNKKNNYIFFDVGLDYDPEKGAFDHHQKNGPIRQNGVPYSSLGLIWDAYGEYFLRNLHIENNKIEKIWEYIDSKFIELIDASDNGFKHPEMTNIGNKLLLPLVIESFNNNTNGTQKEEDDTFIKTSSICHTILLGQIENASSYLNAFDILTNAKNQQEDSRYLILEKDINYLEPLLDMGDQKTLFVILPRSGKWYISAVNKGIDTFELRHPLPKDWGGLIGEDLETVSGVQGAVFCHKGCFIAANKTKEGSILMVQKILKH
jgi:uncharacterized UPF0160 family protein